MRSCFIFLILLTISSSCLAEVSLGVIKSYHPTSSEKHNEEHYALGWKHNDSGIFAAYVNSNSYGDPIAMAGYLFQGKKAGAVTTELFVGGVLGYKDNMKISYAGVSPYFWVGAKIDSPWDRVSFRVRMVPSVFTVSLEYRLK